MSNDELDQNKAEEFAERMLDVVNDGALALMTTIGHRTGLFDAMAGLPPSTSAADRRGGRARTSATSASGSGRWSPAGSSSTTRRTRTYAPAARARRLPDAGGRARQPGRCTAQYIPVLAQVEDRLVEASATAAACPTRPTPASTR